jgi:dihydrofolate reductase
MGRLIYGALASLDGLVADERGGFSFAAPDDEVHQAVNDLSRGAGTMLLGRRMYEVLSAWETMDTAGEPPAMADFRGIWLSSEKVVYSRSLDRVVTARTRLERSYDADVIRRLKAGSERDLTIGGPTLAAHALRDGLVDEIQLFLAPVVVGGGLRALPDGIRLSLSLIEERRFAGGTVLLRYRPDHAAVARMTS